MHHAVWTATEGKPKWSFNGSMTKPTFSPSLLINSVSIPDVLEKDNQGRLILDTDGRVKGAKDTVCHIFITNGNIQYLSDCTHHLAGQTIPIPLVSEDN